MNVRLTPEQKEIHILNSTDIYKIMQQVLLRENKIRRNQEHFWVLGMDKSNKVLFVELVSLGASNRVQIAPPEVFRMGIYKMAVSMILIHNHPAGLLVPSDEDNDLTDRMMKAAKMININVVDHLIISEKSFYSFKDSGVLDNLKNNGRYVLIDKEKAALQELKAKAEKEKAVKENQLEIAKKMFAKGYDIDTVKELTGLYKWELKKIQE